MIKIVLTRTISETAVRQKTKTVNQDEKTI